MDEQRASTPPVPASDFAATLFNGWVIASENMPSASTEIDSYRNDADFQEGLFHKKRFLYTIASVAVALSFLARKRQHYIPAVIAHLRQQVRDEMFRRWGYTDGPSDLLVQEASENLAKLVFTNPKDQPALSFEWAKEWLKDVGINEFNPVTLFKFSHNRKENVLTLINTIQDLSSK